MNAKTRQRHDVRTAEPYTALAAGYDVVMQYIDYAFWAGHVHDLLERHHPHARDVLEVGCGTGSLAMELQPLGDYRYRATDRSSDMIEVGRLKAERRGRPVSFSVADFTDYRVSDPADVALLLYDGVNYVLNEDGVKALLKCTFRAVKAGGVFIIDQSTPANSINNETGFEDEGGEHGFHYVRRSCYDPTTRLHTTTFNIQREGNVFQEEHVQRAYALSTILRLIRESHFEHVAAYDGFTTDPARPDSERVHHVLRRPG